MCDNPPIARVMGRVCPREGDRAATPLSASSYQGQQRDAKTRSPLLT